MCIRDRYYRGPTDEYEADDVLWEIESERTETEKHFRLVNGSNIAVAYSLDVYKRQGVKVAAVATNAVIAGGLDYASQKKQYSLES